MRRGIVGMVTFFPFIFIISFWTLGIVKVKLKHSVYLSLLLVKVWKFLNCFLWGYIFICHFFPLNFEFGFEDTNSKTICLNIKVIWSPPLFLQFHLRILCRTHFQGEIALILRKCNYFGLNALDLECFQQTTVMVLSKLREFWPLSLFWTFHKVLR